MASLSVKIMTQRTELAALAATEVNLPAADGYLGILVGHAPLISTLGIGIIAVRHDNGKAQQYFVARGMFSVNGNSVQILADIAESKEQIDLERAQASHTRATKRLREAVHSDTDIDRASESLRRAQQRLVFLSSAD